MQPTYFDGTYDTRTGGTWHLEDAPFKAQQILRMLRRHPELRLKSVCDIGCGAGGVLGELSRALGPQTHFTGYEESPQAHRLSARFENEQCTFLQQEAFSDPAHYDLALVLDVVEHVEDCFTLMRRCAAKATWKMYHIPLDTSASLTLRGKNYWDAFGHLHLFTLETALKSIAHCDQEIVDWFLTPAALERPGSLSVQITNIGRRLLPSNLASRLLGGYSLMVLAQ